MIDAFRAERVYNGYITATRYSERADPMMEDHSWKSEKEKFEKAIPIMKALSVMQPWATLIALGAKRIETRSWSTSYRGPLAIHASGRISREAAMALHELQIREALAVGRYHEGSSSVSNPFTLPLGAVIAIVTLVDVWHITPENIPTEPERSFGDYAPGRFAWLLDDVRRLPEPIVAKGSLGLWEWRAGSSRQVFEQIIW